MQNILVIGKAQAFLEEESAESGEIHFYDSVTGKDFLLHLVLVDRSPLLWRSLNPTAGLRFVMKK